MDTDILMKMKFDECLKLVSYRPARAETTYVYRVVDEKLWDGCWDKTDLIRYADGYCGNYGGRVQWLGDLIEITVYTD